MGFFITEEKELPEFSNTDANKVLKVDASGLYLQWLQETTTPAELPSQTENAGRLLTTNGTTPSWTNGPIGLGTTGAATPMLWFGASNNGFAEAWTAGGGATGISAITNGAICCTFQSNGVRLPGGVPIRSNGNAAARFQFTQDVPNIQNSVTSGSVGNQTTTISRITLESGSTYTSNVLTASTSNTSGSGSCSEYAIEVQPNKISFQRFVSGSTATIGARTEVASIDAQNFNLNGLGILSSGSAWVNISSRLRWNDTLYIEPTQGATTGSVSSSLNFFVGTPGTTAGDTLGRFLAERLTIGSVFTTVRNTLNCLSLNGTGGTAGNPAIIFGDNTNLPAANRSGIYGADDSVSISTNGVQRFEVNNNGVNTSSRFISSRGLAISNGYSFNGTDIAGLYASSTDNTMHLVSSTVPVLSVLNVGGTGGTGGTSTATVNGNLTISQQIIQPTNVITVTANSQTFDLGATFSNNVIVDMGGFTPVVLRFLSSGFTNGMSFYIVPNSNLSGAVLQLTPIAGVTLRVYQGGLTNNFTTTVDVSTRASLHCTFHNNIWYINSHWMASNATFPGTVTATGFSSSGSASITNNLTVGGTVEATRVELPSGQEVRFGTVSSLTNCIRGGTESSQFFVSITVNTSRNVIFRPDRSEFEKHIEQTKCPIQDYANHNTSGVITLGTNSPPIYFISRPQQHTVTAKLLLPSANTASIPDGWTIKIIHLDQGGFASAFAQVEFTSDSVNLWSDGTQTAFNAGESKNIPIGSCWTIMCHKILNKWVVTGWSKP